MDEFSKLARFLKHYKGYDYFMACVYIVAENEEALKAVTKEIYIPVAKQFCTSHLCVERDIRYMRDSVWRHGEKEMMEKFWGAERGNAPTNRELIELYVDHLD